MPSLAWYKYRVCLYAALIFFLWLFGLVSSSNKCSFEMFHFLYSSLFGQSTTRNIWFMDHIVTDIGKFWYNDILNSCCFLPFNLLLLCLLASNFVHQVCPAPSSLCSLPHFWDMFSHMVQVRQGQKRQCALALWVLGLI